MPEACELGSHSLAAESACKGRIFPKKSQLVSSKAVIQTPIRLILESMVLISPWGWLFPLLILTSIMDHVLYLLGLLYQTSSFISH